MAYSKSRAITLPTLASTLLLLCGQAMGQSFNVDINNTSGNGSGVPANSFAGAAGQAGFWNSITSATATTSTLKDLNGNNTSASFTRDTTGTFTSAADAGVAGEAAKLMLDYQGLTSFGTLTYSFNNLAAGTYAVFTYADLPGDSSNESGVTVTGSSSSYQYCGGAMSASKLIPGVTHAIHVITVSAGGSITVKVADSIFGTAHVNGLQLRKIDSNRLRFYVNDNASGASDGTSWATAYTDLQTPLVAAQSIGGAYVDIWTAQGFYYPTSGTSRTASFVIPSGLHLYGGFAGTETTLAQRTSPWSFITAMSGAIGGSAQTDNSYHVVDADNTLGDTLIDGFSIARGYASGGSADGRGGGMTAVNSSIVCKNVKFLSNFASGDGGAAISTNGSPKYIDCLFYDNWTSGEGGAVYHHTSGSTLFANTEFIDNHCTGSGGAVKILYAFATAEGCVFNGNLASAGDGGAIACSGDTGVGMIVRMSTFANNTAPSGTAGGLYVSTGTDATITNSIFWGNADGVPNTTAESQIFAVNFHGSFYTALSTTIEGQSPDPKFIDINGADNIPGTFDDNFRLQSTSPAIDAGNNSLVSVDSWDFDNDFNYAEKWSQDIDGNPRLVDVPFVTDTGVGPAPVIDRGAFEFQYTPCDADFNNDGFVNGDDYDAFASAFEAGDIAADLNNDGFVNGDDYDMFASHFESGC
ncbi:MAG: GC-type dockerin domain-anchored protein [Phycisphaerales bacterium]